MSTRRLWWKVLVLLVNIALWSPDRLAAQSAEDGGKVLPRATIEAGLAVGSWHAKTLVGHAAFAEDEPPAPIERLEHLALRLRAAEKAVEKRLLSESLRVHFYGYLDASYTQNFNTPSNRINELRIFDVNSNQSRFNVGQVVLEREALVGGDGLDRIGLKVKFNAGRDSDFIGGNNIGPWADFQEYYVQYLAPLGSGLDLKLGQMYSIVGYEVVESPRNANYSRSWLFGLGQPFTTRGARVSYEFNKQVSLSVGVIGYINSARADTQHDPLVEYALALIPSDKIKLTWDGLAGPRAGPSGTPGGNLFLTGGFFLFLKSHSTSPPF